MHGAHWKERPRLEGDLSNFRNNGLSNGFDNTRRLHPDQPPTEVSDDVLRGMLNMYLSMVGLEFFLEYYQSGVGNPEGPKFQGKTVTNSDLHALYNAWIIARHIADPERIVEIGPGYGALAATLRRLYPNAEIVLVDLPEHRPVTEYYLEETVGLKNITITTELPDTADLVIALRCMMEMPPEEVEKYIDWVQGNDVSWFYLINRYLKQNVTKFYPFDDHWLPVISRNDYLTGMLHEFLLKRMAYPSDMLQSQLETLPPYIYENSLTWMKGSLRMAAASDHKERLGWNDN